MSRNDTEEAVSILSFISSSLRYINRIQLLNEFFFNSYAKRQVQRINGSQLIRYNPACSLYSDFSQRHRILSNKLVNQDFKESSGLIFQKDFRNTSTPC
jgi:hypothetical protein